MRGSAKTRGMAGEEPTQQVKAEVKSGAGVWRGVARNVGGVTTGSVANEQE